MLFIHNIENRNTQKKIDRQRDKIYIYCIFTKLCVANKQQLLEPTYFNILKAWVCISKKKLWQATDINNAGVDSGINSQVVRKTHLLTKILSLRRYLQATQWVQILFEIAFNFSKYLSVQPKPGFWFRPETNTETKIGRNFWANTETGPVVRKEAYGTIMSLEMQTDINCS